MLLEIADEKLDPISMCLAVSVVNFYNSSTNSKLYHNSSVSNGYAITFVNLCCSIDFQPLATTVTTSTIIIIPLFLSSMNYEATLFNAMKG